MHLFKIREYIYKSNLDNAKQAIWSLSVLIIWSG